MKILYSIGMMVLAVTMIACPASQPLEMSARDGIAAAKGYLDSAKSKHPECVEAGPHATPVSAQCTMISKGVAAKDLTIDALDAYCSNDEYQQHGGACAPNKDAKPKLESALSNLDDIMKQVKSIVGAQ